jgi:acyl dehydratase
VSQGDAKVCTSLSTLFVRGGGGFGGSVGDVAPAAASPDGPADLEIAVPTQPNQALLYRLLGDRNPLHADPSVARASGFEAPILHGACTFGIACATILRSFCELQPTRLARLAARFAGPLYPGETLVFSFWHDQDRLLFRAVAKERGTAVLDSGAAMLRA